MWAHKWWKGKRGWLRPWIVSLVSRSPKNGAEIMDEIEKMSWGYWRPSPGSVYPLLDELAKEGIIKKREDGKYELAQGGKEEAWWPMGLHQQPQTIDDMLDEMSGYLSYLEDLSKSDKPRMAPYKERLKALNKRLSRVVE